MSYPHDYKYLLLPGSTTKFFYVVFRRMSSLSVQTTSTGMLWFREHSTSFLLQVDKYSPLVDFGVGADAF